jgi:beta-glucosidase/6-phospho-beta-glucosidase/beta-galactosidase
VFHGAFLRFLQTGNFSLRIPFYCNYQFSIDDFKDPKTRPLDFIGLQYYTDPLLRFPKGSVSRVKGEKLTCYQYRMYPQGIASALEELATLQIPIDITETGIDVEVNQGDDDRERILFFDRIFQSVQQAIDHGIEVRSLHFWTKDKSWEWAEGSHVDFSLYDEKGPRGSALWLKSLTLKN